MTSHPEPGASLPAVSQAGLRAARQLLHQRGRAARGALLVEGPQAVREALGVPGLVVRLILDETVAASPDARALMERARAAGVSAELASGDDVATLCQTVHAQGVVAVCRQPRAELDDLGVPRLVLLAHEVRDPGNLGSLIRNADAFGADAVVLTPGCVEVWNPKVVRSTTGSLFHLPVVSGVALAEAASWLHARGAVVLAADACGVPLDVVAARGGLDGPVAWVVGNEARGFAPADLDLADEVVSIPMWGRAESLNVAAASAVCLFVTASRQRRDPGVPGPASVGSGAASAHVD